MRLKPPETIHSPLSGPWKNRLPQNWSLVPIRLGTAALAHLELSEDALESVLCSKSFSSAAVRAVECEGWDFPRVWDGRLITVSPRELKLLSLSLPKHQLARAAAPSKQTALERTRAGVPLASRQEGGEGRATEGSAARGAASTGTGLGLRGPCTPTPEGGGRLSRGSLCPGRVMICYGCFYSLLWKPLDPALSPFRLTESRCSSCSFLCGRAHAYVCVCPRVSPHILPLVTRLTPRLEQWIRPVCRAGLLCCGHGQRPQSEGQQGEEVRGSQEIPLGF